MKIKFRNITLLLTTLIAILLCISIVGVGYAYFDDIKVVNDTLQFAIGANNNEILINSAEDLIRYGSDSTYNNYYKVSGQKPNNHENGNRFVLKLNIDITLKSDIYITADAHINLNGKKIITNGKSINIKHNYYGSIVIENGFITPNFDSASKPIGNININTPNAVIIINNITFPAEMTDANKAIYISQNAVVANTALTANAAMLMINNVLENLNSAHKNLYQEVNDADIMLSKNIYCPFHNDGDAKVNHNCCFVSSDIDLPFYFYNNAVSITYTSSDTTVISNKGKVTPPTGNVVETVTLTATVIVNTTTYTKNFIIHVINSNDKANLVKAGIVISTERLEPYKKAETLNGVTSFKYVFNSDIMLPINCQFNSTLKYKYEVYDTNGVNLLGSTETLTTSPSSNAYFSYDSNVFDGYLYKQNKIAKKMKITCISDAINTFITLDLSSASGMIKDRYTIAQEILNHLYGNEIVIKDETGIDTDTVQFGYTAKKMIYDLTAVCQEIGVEFKDIPTINSSNGINLLNNTEKTYEIADWTNNTTTVKLLRYKRGSIKPDIAQSVYLSVSFTYSNPAETIDVTVPIKFQPVDSGDNVTLFEAYYRYFDNLFKSATLGVTYKSFDFPFNYNTKDPVFYFDIKTIDIKTGRETDFTDTDLMKVTLRHEAKSYTKDQVIAMPSTELERLASAGNAKWHFEIDITKISSIDTKIMCYYRYKFTPYTVAWSGANGANDPAFVSKFIIPGVVRNEGDNIKTLYTGMPDANLYKKIYELYTTNGVNDKYDINLDKNKKLILISWLNKEIPLLDNFPISTDTNKILNYKGLEYLKNVKSLNLTNANVEYDDIICISEMLTLQQLNLSNNTLSEAVRAAYLPSGNNGLISKYISKLKNLKIIHLENNKISSFKGLADLPQLKEAYLYNNIPESTISKDAQGDAYNIAQGLLEVVKALYGSIGATNIPIFVNLSQKGIKIYNIEGGMIYTVSDKDNELYSTLSSIEYQKKLPIGANIEGVYSSLSTTLAHFNITAKHSGDFRPLYKTPVEGSLPYLNELSMYKDYTDTINYQAVLDNETATTKTTNKFSITYTYYQMIDGIKVGISSYWVHFIYAISTTVEFNIERF
ncbi:MAG: hypothetical protein RR316_03255 [Clostridia bacterium]